jgi:Family of unknown function (DUF6064)
MSEWWTYSLSDFLLFSPRTYYRLFELHNRAIWPAQLVALALGAAILGLLRVRAAWQGRVVAVLLAACWAFVAWAFLLERYSTINWAASYFAVAFLLEALLLLWRRGVQGLSFRPRPDLVGCAGLSIFLFALVLQPLIGPLLGRPWTQVEVFGIAPDPTVIATMGLLLVASGRVAWEFLVIPLSWCAISGATLWAMGSSDAVVPALAASLVLLLAIWNSFPRADRSRRMLRSRGEVASP